MAGMEQRAKENPAAAGAPIRAHSRRCGEILGVPRSQGHCHPGCRLSETGKIAQAMAAWAVDLLRLLRGLHADTGAEALAAMRAKNGIRDGTAEIDATPLWQTSEHLRGHWHAEDGDTRILPH